MRYSLPPPPLLLFYKFFRYQKFCETQKGSPTKFFPYCETKQFWRKIVIPTPSLIANNFRHQKVSETQHRECSPCEIFRHCETKAFRQKIAILPSSFPLLIYKNFRYPNFCETQKGFSTKCFGIVRQNNFDRKSWYPPPLLSLKFSGTRNLLKHSTEGFLYVMFRYCQTKKVRQKIVTTPS